MYRASTNGGSKGRSGAYYSWAAGDKIDAPKGDLSHVGSLTWIGESNAPEPEGLPDDFPARDKLVGAGYETEEAILDAGRETIGEIKGIGPATLNSIYEALNA